MSAGANRRGMKVSGGRRRGGVGAVIGRSRRIPGTALAKNPRDCSGRKAPCATPRGVAQHAFSVRSGARGFFPRAQMCAKKLPRASSTGQLLILELCEALQPRLALDRPRCPRAAVRTVLAVAVLEDAFEVSARAGGGAAAARGEAADRHVAEIVRTHDAHPVPLTAVAVAGLVRPARPDVVLTALRPEARLG